MPSIREYLPGVPTQYWKIYQKLVAAPNVITVPAGSVDQGILPSAIADRRGLFSHFHMVSNSSALIFTITIDDTQISGTISALNAAGYVGYYIPGVPWLSVYDTTTNVYVVNVIAEAMVPFYRNVSVSVSNPSTSAIVISAMEFDAYLLNAGFYAALAKVMSGSEQGSA